MTLGSLFVRRSLLLDLRPVVPLVRRAWREWALWLLSVGIVVAAVRTTIREPVAAPEPSTFVLTSPVVRPDMPVPAEYTCASGDQMRLPSLEWSAPPRGTVALALVATVDRGQAGDEPQLVWRAWNVPSELRGIPETPVGAGGPPAALAYASIEAGGCHGEWAGPHRHVFELYALGAGGEAAAPEASDLLRGIRGGVLAPATLTAWVP